MAISKPSWLRNALDHLNWDILTWKVYVGDAVESGIDWAIDWINWGISQAESAWNKAIAAWDKVIDVFWDLTAVINYEISKVWNNIETWWDDLSDWWTTRVTIIQGWIDAAGSTLHDSISTLGKLLASLSVIWDNFWTTTWPQLVKDFNTLLVQIGNFFTGILPGLATLLDVGKAFDDFRLELIPIWDLFTNFGKDIVAFFTDPIDWIWSKLVDYLERRW